MKKTEAEHLAITGLISIAACILLGFAVTHATVLVKFDQILNLSLTLSPSSPLLQFAITLSNIGEFWPVAIVSVIISVLLFIKVRIKDAWSLLVTVGVAGILSDTLKYFFLTERPTQTLAQALGPAYPSGHATVIWALVTIIFLASALHLPHRAQRLLSTLLLISLATGVAISRLLLGVHWFSDIAGGTFLGIGTALAVFGLAHIFDNKRISQ